MAPAEARSPAIGLLHPGAMGASLGAALVEGGHRVLWCARDRSAATAARAEAARLRAVADLAALCADSQVILSVCPPDAALDLAGDVAARGFAGLYVDANAVAPATARAIEARFAGTGAGVVDGGVIGPPVTRPGSTHLRLSGARAAEAAALFAGGPVDVGVLDAPVGAASALKMAFAAYTKGSSALLAAIEALATQHGVREALRAEWAVFLPDLAARADRGVPAAAAKAWRFEGEMREIAATFGDADLPAGFHQAAAEVYARLHRFRDADPLPELDEVLRALARKPER